MPQTRFRVSRKQASTHPLSQFLLNPQLPVSCTLDAFPKILQLNEFDWWKQS